MNIWKPPKKLIGLTSWKPWSFHTAAPHARATSTVPNCIMDHWTSENAPFAVTKLVHGSPLHFFHNVHCSLWYVLEHKDLALLPWQPRATSHTMCLLTVFFSPSSSNVCTVSFREARYDIFRISSHSKQVDGILKHLSRKKWYNVSTVTQSLDRWLS